MNSLAVKSPRSTTGFRGGPLVRIFVSLLMVVAVVFTAISLASPAMANKDDDLQGAMSFYNLGSSTSALLSNTLSPDFPGERDGVWDVVTERAGNAGSMTGYTDPYITETSSWLLAKLTTGSNTMNYSAFTVKETSSESSESTARMGGIVDYMHFGATLNGLGLDKTSGGANVFRGVNILVGGSLWLLYSLTTLIDSLFAVVITALRLLNPFQLFYLGVAAVNPTFANGMVGGSVEGLPAGLSDTAEFIGGWYLTLNHMSWSVMVPLFFTILVFMLLLSKKVEKGTAIRKFFIRVAFFGIGLPLVGTMYTGALKSLSDATVDGTSASSKVILSTFVDFESWAMNNALYVPNNATIAWDVKKARPTSEASKDVQETAYKINVQANSNFADADTSEVGVADILDLFVRYMNVDTITGADYETKVKGTITRRVAGNEDAQDRVKSWFLGLNGNTLDLNDPGKTLSESSLSVEEAIGTSTDGNGILLVQNGLQAGTANEKGFSSIGTPACRFAISKPSDCNMSPLAMYNYLNTSFGPESYVVYSSDNSASAATRGVHRSVNLVGTGVSSGLYWMSAVTVLGALVVISVGYALGMFIASIRRTISLITSVPFAMLGALQSIAQVIIYSVALIVEVFITIFAYLLISDIIVSIPELVEEPLNFMLTVGGTVSLPGNAQSSIITLIVILVMLLFTKESLKLRKVLVKAVEDAVTKLINTFTGTSAGAPSANTGLGAKQLAASAAGGLASGAGTAMMANKMASNKNNNDEQPSNAGGTNGSNDKSDGDKSDDNRSSSPGTPSPIETEESGRTDQVNVDGQVDTGSPVEASDGSETPVQTESEETAHGRNVAENGWSRSEDEGVKHSSPQAAPDAEAPNNDVVDNVQASMDESKAKYAEADELKKEQKKQTAKAVTEGAKAVVKAHEGDAAGAVQDGANAAGALGAAGAAGKAAKDKKVEAETSQNERKSKPGKNTAKPQSNGRGRRTTATGGSSSKPMALPKPKSDASPGKRRAIEQQMVRDQKAVDQAGVRQNVHNNRQQDGQAIQALNQQRGQQTASQKREIGKQQAAKRKQDAYYTQRRSNTASRNSKDVSYNKGMGEDRRGRRVRKGGHK